MDMFLLVMVIIGIGMAVGAAAAVYAALDRLVTDHGKDGLKDAGKALLLLAILIAAFFIGGEGRAEEPVWKEVTVQEVNISTGEVSVVDKDGEIWLFFDNLEGFAPFKGAVLNAEFKAERLVDYRFTSPVLNLMAELAAINPW